MLQGKVTERFLSIYAYIMLVIPYTLLHYPDMLLASPINAIFLIALSGIVFDLPMALLMKRKNLQMAIGMHWFIDFVRFAAGVLKAGILQLMSELYRFDIVCKRLHPIVRKLLQ